MSDAGGRDVSLEVHFEPREDDCLYEVQDIIGERKNTYLVRWAGNDPKTNKPWKPSWVAKTDCTDDLVIAWKLRRQKATATAAKKAAKGKKKEVRKESMHKSERITRSSTKALSKLSVLVRTGPIGPPQIAAGGEQSDPITDETNSFGLEDPLLTFKPSSELSVPVCTGPIGPPQIAAGGEQSDPITDETNSFGLEDPLLTFKPSSELSVPVCTGPIGPPQLPEPVQLGITVSSTAVNTMLSSHTIGTIFRAPSGTSVGLQQGIVETVPGCFTGVFALDRQLTSLGQKRGSASTTEQRRSKKRRIKSPAA